MGTPLRTDLTPGDYVISKHNGEYYKVKDIDTYWGWFTVYENNKTYRLSDSWIKATKEQIADHYLAMATAGKDDSWREY